MTPTFITTFNRATGLISIQDTTDYAALGYIIGTNSNMEGFLRVTYNTGAGEQVIYDNLAGTTADVSNNLGPTITFNANIPIPVVTDDEPIPATYTVTYLSKVYFGLLVDTGTAANSYDYSVVDPEVCLDTTVNCLTSSLQSEDATDYTIAGATIDSIIRAHTLYPPPTSGLTQMGPLNLSTLVYTPISTSTWTAEVISTVTYTLDSGLVMIVQYEGVKEFLVQCDTNLNKIMCCLTGLEAQYEAMLCDNPVKAANFRKLRLDPTLQHLVLFLAAQQAGNATKMASEYAAMVAVSGCSEDCDCTNDVSIVQVNGGQNGATSSYAVDSPNTTIQVITQVIGNVTTFHLEVSPGLLGLINNLGVTTVSTLTPSWLTILQTGIAPNYNYQINFNPSALGDVIPEVESRLEILVPAASPYATGVINSFTVNGGIWNPGGSHTLTIGQGSPNVGADIALFRYQNFLAGAAVDYNVETSYMNVGTVPTDLNDIEAHIYWFDPASTTGDFIIRLYNPTNGQPYTLTQLGSLIGSGTAYITVTIKAKV